MVVHGNVLAPDGAHDFGLVFQDQGVEEEESLEGFGYAEARGGRRGRGDSAAGVRGDGAEAAADCGLIPNKIGGVCWAGCKKLELSGMESDDSCCRLVYLVRSLLSKRRRWKK